MTLTNLCRVAMILVPALALGVLGVGCAAEVVGGPGPDQGGGGAASAGETGGAGGGGGGGVCKVGEYRTCSDPSLPSYEQGAAQEVCQDMGSGPEWGPCEANTPLVLSFDGAPVEFRADAAHGFDVNGAASQVTDWPTARTPWLAIDRDGNGSIDDGAELFGSMSPLAQGGRARNGFVALRELDTNGDGRITAEDEGFAELLVWSDRDGDRRSSAGELVRAADLGLVSIDLGYVIDRRCDARFNCEVERARFRFVDAAGVVRTGDVVDVRLPAQR
jgi:hypothetical protein